MKKKTLLDVVRSNNFLVLDTETTGLGHQAEICQIAIINQDGVVLLDTLVKPSSLIPGDATRIHGITNDMVESAPTWEHLRMEIARILHDKDVIIYNADYDVRIMEQSSNALGEDDPWTKLARYYCAMQAFAVIAGDWSDYHQSYRWHKLTTAARYYDVPVINAHNALADCQMTLGVVKGMLKAESDE